MDNLTVQKLMNALADPNYAAFRFLTRLQPVGGKGDKVFPPTTVGAKYADEVRLIDGKQVNCFLLDSVQSQANRMELSLLDAHNSGKISIPLIVIDFNKKNLPEFDLITSLEVPHRLADAIIRDSTLNGVRFRETEFGEILTNATLKNCTKLYQYASPSLLFGMWDSTKPRISRGIRIQRAIVSEIVAINAIMGKKISSRIDPLNLSNKAGTVQVINNKTAEWIVVNKGENIDKKLGKFELTAIGHSSIPPTITDGGITFDYALQTVVISLPTLRRLRFPVVANNYADLECQTVLLALGLYAATLTVESGYDLRSRCALVKETKNTTWEIVYGNGDIEKFDLTSNIAENLLKTAISEAEKKGALWNRTPIVLEPSDGLVELIKKSKNIEMVSDNKNIDGE